MALAQFKANVLPQQSMWLFTFVSLFTSLLAFFMFITTKIEIEGVDERRNYQRLNEALTQQVEQVTRAKQVKWLKTENTLQKGVRLQFALNQEFLGTLFEPASAKINPNYLPLLQQLVNVIQSLEIDQASNRYHHLLTPYLHKGAKVAFKIRIEGHTDSTPVLANSRFKNNIELSTYRAYAMMHYLRTRTGLDHRFFSISGYGDLKPLTPLDPEGPQNRRVELYIQPILIMNPQRLKGV
jgi:chemotaxis protein MotB